MELLYLHISEYRGFKDITINFNKNINIQYETTTEIFRCRKSNPRLPKDFWGSNIANLTMVVGNNGAGKTSLMQFIIEMYCNMLYGQRFLINGQMIFMEDDSYFFYSSNGNVESVKMEIINDEQHYNTWVKMNKIHRNNVKKYFSRTKLIYRTGILSIDDYLRSRHNSYGKTDFFYDCSLGGLLQENHRRDTISDIRERIGIQYNVESHFTYEQYKQIKFVFDKNQHRNLQLMKEDGYPVPVPKHLNIGLILNNYLHFQYKQFSDICWKSIAGRFVFTQERIWNDQVDISNLLPLALARAAVMNAFRSFFRLLSINRLREMLFDRLMIWDKNELNISIETSLKNLINWLWDNVEDIISCECNESYDRNIYILLQLKEHYLIFLDYIKEQKLLNHFQYINPSDWIKWVDMSTLRFNIETTDSDWFMDFLQKYRYICNPDYFLDFSWGLSSGEYNLLSLFSSFYYIFTEDYTNNKHGIYKIKNYIDSSRWEQCDSIIVMIDEADLTFHPQWQTEYIAILTEFLTRIYPPECCKSIQLIISTHSPILLGDMPSDHVLYLAYDSDTGSTQVDLNVHAETFGQNIYLLFKDSFFLDNGTMGRFSKSKILLLIKKLENLEKNIELRKGTKNVENLLTELKECEDIVKIIAEPIIRNKLMKQILKIKQSFEKKFENDTYFKKMSDEEIDLQIEKLQREKERRQK